jgi:spore coat polysaccharide biosynthesis protein SpsF
MKKVVILQARISSSRLPRKVLAELAGRPVIHHILDRLETSKEIDEIVVAIPEVPAEDELVDAVAGRDVRIVRGPETNVLTRYTIAAYDSHADIVVRATADNPLVDIGVMDEQLRYIVKTPDTDYIYTKGLPLGVSTETFTRKTLDKLDFLARTPLMREHVTYYLVQNPAPFSVIHLDPPSELAHPELRLTLDTPDDLKVFQAIYGELYETGTTVSTAEAIGLLINRPELARANGQVRQVPA